MESKTKTIKEIAFFQYIGRYFLFMWENEWKFIERDPMNPEVRRANKRILQSIRAYDNTLKAQKMNIAEIFQEFNEEKINALHNTMAMMLELDEDKCLEIENYVENQLKEVKAAQL